MLTLFFCVTPVFASDCGGFISNGTFVSTDDENQNSTAWLIKSGMPSIITSVAIDVGGGGGGVDDTIVSAYLDGAYVGTAVMSKDNQSIYAILNSTSFSVTGGNFSFIITSNRRSGWMSTLGGWDSGSSYCMGDSSCSSGVGYIYADVAYSAGYLNTQCFGDNAGVCDGSGWINVTCQFGCSDYGRIHCMTSFEGMTTNIGTGTGSFLSQITMPFANFLLLLGVIGFALTMVFVVGYTIKNALH